MEYLLDSYAWLEYFHGNSKYIEYIEGNAQYLPITVTISLTEVIRSLIKRKKTREQILDSIEFISAKSVILPIGKEESIKAGFIAEELGLHFSDALIYSFANKDRQLVTGDPHFRNKPNVLFVD